MPQEQVQKQKQTSRSADVQEVDEASADQRDQQLTDDVDDILDEIDNVLEENAAEFVNGFVQKGGQ